MASVTPPGREVTWQTQPSSTYMGTGKDDLPELPNVIDRRLVGGALTRDNVAMFAAV